MELKTRKKRISLEILRAIFRFLEIMIFFIFLYHLIFWEALQSIQDILMCLLPLILLLYFDASSEVAILKIDQKEDVKKRFKAYEDCKVLQEEVEHLKKQNELRGGK